jgi:hypothetical protein
MTNGGLYRVGPFVAVAGCLALLAGCGRFGVFQERDPWRAEAERQCLRAGAVRASWAIERASAISGPGVCGMDYPLRVTAFQDGAVALKQRNTLGCPMVSEIDQWLATVVQPAAQATYGAAVVEIRSGSYSCRSRNNQRGAKLSEHSFGNAIDVFGFRFADGREVTVKSGWRGAPDEQQFLREAFTGACQRFKTVLGPGSDAFHYDHIHLDLARHDPRGLRSVCKPAIKYEPSPGEGRIDRPVLSYRPPQPGQTQPGQTTAIAGAAPLLPRGAIPTGQPFPSAFPPALGARPPAPPSSLVAARTAAAPLDLSGAASGARPAPLAPSARPPARPADSDEEIDPNNDPFALDD